MTTQCVKDSPSADDAVTGTLPISEQGIGVQLNSGSSRRDISLPLRLAQSGQRSSQLQTRGEQLAGIRYHCYRNLIIFPHPSP